jgi:hypothetical protein
MYVRAAIPMAKHVGTQPPPEPTATTVDAPSAFINKAARTPTRTLANSTSMTFCTRWLDSGAGNPGSDDIGTFPIRRSSRRPALLSNPLYESNE